MPRESLSGITQEQSMESLGNLLEAIQEKIEDVTDRDVASLDRKKIREWIEIDQSIERNIEKFVDYRKRAESDPEATAQIEELQSEQEDLRRRAKELVAEFVIELNKLHYTESAREEATVVESAKENKEKKKLLEEAERIKGELSKLFAEVTEYRETLERELEALDAFEDERTKKAAEETKKVIREVSRLDSLIEKEKKLDAEKAAFKNDISKLDSSEKSEFGTPEREMAGLSVEISDEIETIKELEERLENSRKTRRVATPAPGSSPVAAALGSAAGLHGTKVGPVEGGLSVLDGVDVPPEPAIAIEEIEKEFSDNPGELESEEVSDAQIERTKLVGEDEDRLIPPDVVVDVPVHTEVVEAPAIELVDGLESATADVINEAVAAIKDIEVRKKAKKILSDAFRGLDEGKAGQMFLILEFLSYQRKLPEHIVAIQSMYGENKLADKLKTVVDRASHMLRMIESDPEKAELAGRTTVELAEKLHKWCDERGLKGKFFADDEEKYKTSMYWDIAKYDGAVYGGLAITDANPEKKIYKTIADLKNAQFVKDGAMDVGHPDRLTEDELKEIVARCYFDASPLDKNIEAKLRQELSVARMKMWFEEEHEKEEYRDGHDGSTDGFEYSFTKKLREADELAKAEKEGSALLMSALDVAYRGKVEVVLETPLVPGAVRRTRKELQTRASDPKMDKSEHGKSLLRVFEAWAKKQYSKDKSELEFDELTKKWNGAGIDDWIREVGVAEEKKAKAEFEEIKKQISEIEQKARRIRSDVRSLQSIVDIAQGGSLANDQYRDAIKSLSREIKEQWRSSAEFRTGTDERNDLVAFSKRILIDTERLARIEDEKANELRGELAKFKSYAWAHEEAKAGGAHPPKSDVKHGSEDEGGGHDDRDSHDKPAADVAIEKLASAGHHHAEPKEKKLPEFKTIPYEEIPSKPETGSDSPEVFFDGWEYGHRKVLSLFRRKDVVQSEYDTMPEEQKIRLANTLSAIRAEDTTSAAFYETPDPYFKKGYKGEGTKRKGKEDKPKEELLKGVFEPRPFGLKRQDLEKIFAQQAKPGANGEQQKGVFWTQIPSTNVPKHEGERQLFLISLHTTDNKLGEGKPVKFYLDVKREVAERINALLTHDADNAIHIVRGLAKVYSYERFADVPFHHGQTMYAEVPWSSEKKKLEIAPPLPNRPKAGPPIDHGRRNVLAAAVLAGGAYFVGKSEIPRVARMWRKKKPRSEEENYEIKESYGELPALPVDDEISLALRNVSDSDRRNLGVSSNEEFWSEPMKKQRDAGKRGALKPGVVSEFGKNRDEIVSAVKRESEKYGVPERVMYGIIGLESGGKNVAVSELGAAGLYQFIPSTGRAYGLVEYHYTDEQGNIINPKDKEKHKGKKLKRVDTADHRDNIEKSTVAAAKYLRDLYKQYGDWNLVYGAYFLGGPFDKLINAYLKKVRPGENLAVRSLPAGKKLSDYGVSVLTLGYYMHSTGMRDLDIPIIYAENGKPADRKKMLTQQLVPYVYKAEGLSVRIPKEYKINVSETKSSVNEEFSDVDESMLEVDRAPQVPDEEISVSGTSTNTPDVKNLQSTDTSTQTDAVLSRRDLLRGKKPEKAAEAPKGLSADGRWAKNLVSELDKFSDEKMNRSEKDKLIQAILSAEERTNNIARSTAPLSKEDYDAIIDMTKKVIEKMQWADSKLGIVYIQSKHVDVMNKKLRSFEEKRKRVR